MFGVEFPAVTTHYQAAVVNQTPAAVKQTTSFLLQSSVLARSAFKEKSHFMPTVQTQEHTLHACNHTHAAQMAKRYTQTRSRTYAGNNCGIGRG